MFVDTAKVLVQAGKGGDGAVSFRHEIYVDKGGPDGGDGGKGGDVIFEATRNLNTLLDFRYKPELRAKPGEAGSKRNRHGKNGSDLIVKVPVGTVISRDGEAIADLAVHGQKAVVAHGGDGGFGNAHFKSSVRQTPRMAELGEAGEEFEAELELKLLADVGLIGFPNAGKSTFLSVVSNARPEIADYAFTTLVPNLGVASVDDGSLLIADIPGLIEGASEGKGLGDAFLRHVERTAVLMHMIDAYSDDVAASYKTIRNELAQYSPELVKRPELVVLTKIDGLDDDIVDMQTQTLRKVVPADTEIFAISSTAHKGLKDLLRSLRKVADAERENTVSENLDSDEAEVPIIRLDSAKLQETWQIDIEESEGGSVYVVSGEKIERFARRTNFDQHEAVTRLRDIMKKMGIIHELTRMGAESTSVIRIAGREFTLVEQ